MARDIHDVVVGGMEEGCSTNYQSVYLCLYVCLYSMHVDTVLIRKLETLPREPTSVGSKSESNEQGMPNINSPPPHCVCMCVCVCVYATVCMYVCMHLFMYVCMYVCFRLFVCMYVCMYVLCMYVCMYVCNYVCTHTHT